MAAYTKPRYGKEVLNKRMKFLASDGKRWRTGIVSGYHGGYLRHTVTYDDTHESRQMHLYQEEYRFLPEDNAGPMPDLVQRTITVTSPAGQKVTGEVVGYDGLMHTLQLSDGSVQHFNLRQQSYKVAHEHSTRDRSLRRTAEPAGPAAAQQHEGGGTSGSKKQKQQTSPSNNSAGASGSSKPAAAAMAPAGAVKDKKAVAESCGLKADGSSKPPRRAAADRAAAVAVAVSMGGNAGTHSREDSSRRMAAPHKGAAAAAPAPAPAHAAAAAASATRRGGLDGAGEVVKKLPSLNMSHVSKKDREAARMLLNFSTPTAQEAHTTAHPFTEGFRAPAGMPEGTGSRMAIAAAATAAAAAAGLPDPAAVDEEPASPMHIDEPLLAVPSLAAAVAAAAAAEGVEAGAEGDRETTSPAGAGVAATAVASAAGNGGPVNAAVLHQVLSAMQRQMQKLISLEERRAVDIVRLNARVARLQDERDDSYREKETAFAERDAALLQVQQVEEDNVALTERVQLLQREVMQLQTLLSAEREMVGSLCVDAAALQLQLADIRSELGGCRVESSHLLKQFGVTGGDSTAEDVAAAAVAAAAMMNLGGTFDLPAAVPKSEKPRGRPPKNRGAAAVTASGATGMPALDPAAAAALPVPADVITLQAGHVKPTMQPLMPFKAMTEARTLGVGQLMQVGPGKLVVGPRGWRPPVQQPPPPAPPQPKHHGGRKKRGRGFGARMAQQRAAKLQSQLQQQTADEDDEEPDNETDREGSHPEPASSGHTPAAAAEHEAPLLLPGAAQPGPQQQQLVLVRPLSEQPSSEQQQHSADGQGPVPASAPASRDITPAAVAEAAVPPAPAGTQGASRTGSLSVPAASMQQVLPCAQQVWPQQPQPQPHHPQQQLQVKAQPLVNGAAPVGEHSRSPTPDKRQQADQDSSNGSMASKKRRRDDVKAAVTPDGDAAAAAPVRPAVQAGGEAAAPGAAAVQAAGCLPGGPSAQQLLQQRQQQRQHLVGGVADSAAVRAPAAAPAPAPAAAAVVSQADAVAGGADPAGDEDHAPKRIKSETGDSGLPLQQQKPSTPAVLQL